MRNKKLMLIILTYAAGILGASSKHIEQAILTKQNKVSAYASSFAEKHALLSSLNLDQAVLQDVGSFNPACYAKIPRPLSYQKHETLSHRPTVSFSSDNKFLASALESGIIEIWDAQTNEQPLRTIRALSQNIKTLAFRPGTQELAVLSDNKEEGIKIWSLANPSDHPEFILTHHTMQKILSFAYNIDGSLLASGGENGEIVIRSVKDLYSVNRTLTLETEPGTKNPALAIKFSPDNQSLAVASRNKITIWDAQGLLKQTLCGHKGYIHTLALSPDGGKIASASTGPTIKIWNPSEGTLLHAIEIDKDRWPNRYAHSVVFNSDGTTLMATLSDGSIRFWNTNDYSFVDFMKSNLLPQPFGLAITSDSKILATTIGKTLFTWKLPVGVAADQPPLQFELIKRAAMHRVEMRSTHADCDTRLPLTTIEGWQIYRQLPKMFKGLFEIKPELQAKVEEIKLLKKANRECQKRHVKVACTSSATSL